MGGATRAGGVEKLRRMRREREDGARDEIRRRGDAVGRWRDGAVGETRCGRRMIPDRAWAHVLRERGGDRVARDEETRGGGGRAGD